MASSVLMTARIANDNPNLSMDNIKRFADLMGVSFFDREYANRISPPGIPLITSLAVPQAAIDFMYCDSLEYISHIMHEGNFFAKEQNRFYLNMPKVSNLNCNFNISIGEQFNKCLETLRCGGIVIPILHPNTLYGSNNEHTDGFFHAVVVVGLSKNQEKIRIIDPSIGLPHLNNFSLLRERGIRMAPYSIGDRTKLIEFAKKHHPMKNVDYWVPVKRFKKSLRGCTTYINL